MKRTSLFILICIALMAFSGCSKKDNKNDKALSIVTTVFSEYDWVKNILGDRLSETELILLTDNGVDLHSYQPSVSDIVKITNCDIFIYTGGESDSWVKDALKGSENSGVTVLNLMEILGNELHTEEIVEGMQSESDGHNEEDDSDAPEYDEHIWLSVKNAEKLCGFIADTISAKDPENEEIYTKNLEAYLNRLDEIDRKYKETINGSEKKTLLFADRFPFRYLTEDYGLSYYAAFSGCSAESEAGFSTISFLAGKIDELGLDTVLILENSDSSIAETVIKNSSHPDAEIEALDSMQSITREKLDAGANYADCMLKNLEIINKALN